MTEKYPDICQMILTLLTRPLPERKSFPSDASTPSDTVLDLLKSEKITSLIMDAEVVAVDKDTGAYRTFQELTNRAKKDVRVEDIKVIVGVYAFDLMLLNDRVCYVPHRLEDSAEMVAIARVPLLASSPSASNSPTAVRRRRRPSSCALRPRRVARFVCMYRHACRDAGVLRTSR